MPSLAMMPLWLVMLGVIAGTTTANAQPTLLRLSHFLGSNSFFQKDFAQPWAHELETRTNGKVKVEIYDGSSSFGQVTKQAGQVKAGDIDIALGLRGAEGDRFTRSSIIELPFVVSNALDGSRTLWSLFKDGTLGGEYQDYKVLALFVHNPGLIHTTSKRIIQPDDLRSERLRAPNQAVAAVLQSLGAKPAILQVNDVMPAVKNHSIDGIVTNWGNPLPGFNDYMKHHTDIAFYTSAFFVVMNRQKFDSLPPDVQAVIDELSNESLVTRFGLLWNEWDRPVREGAGAPGHEIIVPDAAQLAQWRAALRPAAIRYLDTLAAGGFTNAPAIYERLIAAQR